MLKILLIAIGGGVGTFFRYIISGADNKLTSSIFPINTVIINISGSLIIGFLWGLFERINISSTMRMFIFIGILGGFTTFSTFSLESFYLFRNGEFKTAFYNIILTNFLGIVFVFVGFGAARFMTNIVERGIKI